jgi:glutamyl-tRNA reductase
VDLSTCHRCEWIVSTPDPRRAGALLASRMVERLGPGAGDWFAPYVHLGEAAAKHVFRVALGQESLVLGERQIAGQLQDALEKARGRNTSSRVLNGLGTTAGRLVRRAIREGKVGSSSVGVHSLAVTFLSGRLGAERRARIALVGLGEIGRRALGSLEQVGRFEIIQVNRTISPGLEDRVRPISELPLILEQVDAALVCTGAPKPILRASDLPSRSADRPLLILDVGIPEQVDREGVGTHVTVAGLDELTAYHCQGRKPPPEGSDPEADQLVRGAIAELRVFCNQPAFAEILDALQRRHHRVVEEQLPKIIAERLGHLPDAERARIGRDLHALVLGYTQDLFQSVRNASERLGKEK